MTNNIRILISAVKLSFSGRMAYRADFIISMLAMIVIEFIFPMVSVLIYSHGAFFPEWSLDEMLLLQGIFITSRGLALPFFIGMFFTVTSRVQQGAFDIILLRPKSALFVSMVQYIHIQDCSKAFGGILLMAIAIAGIGVPGPIEWLAFLLLLMASVVIQFSCIVIFSAASFKWVGVWRSLEIFNTLSTPGQYPRTVFPKSVGYILTYVFPASIMAFFPASALLGRFSVEMVFTIVMAFLFLAGSLAFWRSSIKKHTSAGG